MSSIVYITDRQMIEYHRLNGNRTMNFWRSGTKKIKDFQPGDLLFFLAKGTERGRSREKGILGYGRFREMSIMSVRQTWKRFGTENGYASEEMLKEAILKVNKNRELPQKISSLYLTNVVYFQEPLYLSDIGIKVSNLVESYFYPDKEDENATSRILQRARKIGLDTWMSMVSEEDLGEHLIEEDENRHFVSVIINQLLPIYSEAESKKARKTIKSVRDALIKRNRPVSYTEGTRSTLLVQTDKAIEIYVPFVFSVKTGRQRIQTIVGHASILRAIIRKQLPSYTVNVIVVSENELPAEYQQILQLTNINYAVAEDNSDSSASL